MERNWFRDAFAASPAADDRERRARKRRRLLIGCAVVAVLLGVLLGVLLARADYRGLGIAYWHSVAQPCGTLVGASGAGIKVGAGPSTAADTQAATTCFLQVYAHCQAATLVESFAFSDQVSTYTYLIEPQLFANASAAHSCSLQVAQGHLPRPPN